MRGLFTSAPVRLGLVVLIVSLIIFFMFCRGCQFLERGFDPSSKITQVIAASVESLHRKAELVVCQLRVTASVHLSQATHWAYIYWGTTTADVTSVGNRVQYIVPLKHITSRDFSYNAFTNTLTCYFPQPVVDTSVVQVQPDRSKIIVHGSSGWALFNKGSLEREAKAELHEAIILQAQKKFLSPLVLSKARQTLHAFLKVLLEAIKPGLHVCVRFEPVSVKKESQ